MNERDKFLTLARGFVWDEEKGYYTTNAPVINNMEFDFISYSTWPEFGKLWTWVQEQEWLEEFLNIMDVGEYLKTQDGFVFDIQSEFINPDRFANTVYKYLKGEKL